MLKCFGCGAQKLLDALELYPYPDEGLIEEPIPPFMVLECQPTAHNGEYRAVVVCHECFHKLDPDMWISQKCWENLNPVIEFDDLPLPLDARDEKWNPENY